jgi:hypothetical protein
VSGLGFEVAMFCIELLSERGSKEVEELLRFARIQRQRLMYLELVQGWHGSEQEAFGWIEHL